MIIHIIKHETVLSVDMEGMPGIFSKLQTDPDGSRYEEGRKIMTDIILIFLENYMQ